jgi:hypothetical protein
MTGEPCVRAGFMTGDEVARQVASPSPPMSPAPGPGAIASGVGR